MAKCYEYCKHNCCGFCSKYNEMILTSRNPMHPGILIHPLHYLNLYYDYDAKDICHLIEIAIEYLEDEVSQNICQQYNNKGYITYKQRKYLVYNILHCCEEKHREYIDYGFTQVE